MNISIVSIPYGTIKSMNLNEQINRPLDVSIPYGTIKSV